MKIHGFLQLFIDDLEAKVGSLYYEDDIGENDDKIRLELEDHPNIVVEVDTLLESMDVYCGFSYYDYHKDERMSAGLEEIEQEIKQYYIQKDFEKALSTRYNVEVWDDDCWGCHCQDVCVGVQQVKCDVAIVKNFVDIYSTLASEEYFGELSNIRNYRIKHLFGEYLNGSSIIIREKDEIDYAPIEDANVVFYNGQEFVLLKNNSGSAAVKKCHYEVFIKLLEEIEIFSDYRTEMHDEFIRFETCSCIIDIPRVDEINAIEIENFYFDLTFEKFLLFASGESSLRLAKTLAENNIQTNNIQKIFSPHIYTEGQTDCLHIKNAMRFLPTFKDKNWIFDEDVKDKGDQQLLKLCQVHGSFSEATCARIAIFDRDGSIPLQEIEEEGKGFKEWGNRMYSFALPIPKHRQSTPKISIEHYYINEELFREYDIGGIKRRLYMGWEFDTIGRAPQIKKICRDLKKCGPENIKIIDSNVYESDSCSTIDYALSKSQFTKKICNSDLSEESLDAFRQLFEKIDKVLEHDKNRSR